MGNLTFRAIIKNCLADRDTKLKIAQSCAFFMDYLAKQIRGGSSAQIALLLSFLKKHR